MQDLIIAGVFLAMVIASVFLVEEFGIKSDVAHMVQAQEAQQGKKTAANDIPYKHYQRYILRSK